MQLGHELVEPFPALTPLTGDHPGPEQIAGVSLDVAASVRIGKRSVPAHRTGFLFTHKGAPPDTTPPSLLPETQPEPQPLLRPSAFASALASYLFLSLYPGLLPVPQPLPLGPRGPSLERPYRHGFWPTMHT